MTEPETLNQLFFGAVDRFAGLPAAMRYKADRRWVDLRHTELRDRVYDVSCGLRSLGVQRGDRVAILSENRPEWAIADYACLTIGAPDVPLYPTLPARQLAYILRDAGAVAIFVSTAAQLAKIDQIRGELPELRHVIVFPRPAGRGGSAPAAPQAGAAASGNGSLTLGDLEARGRQHRNAYPHWREEALAIRPSDVATIIYTSGTTGDPKGVMLSHGNITSNVRSAVSLFDFSERDACLSFLPLSHIFERMAGHYLMFHKGVAIHYATAFDTVASEMLEVRPTIVTAVPRFYERVYERVMDNALTGSRVKRRLFLWGRRNGERWVEHVLAKRRVPPSLALRRALADRLVFAKLRARTGGRIRFFVSGGAPLNPEIAKFFHAAGLPVLEGYGLTETSPVITVNTFEHVRLGTVGRPIPGVEVRIAPDGEILTRGPHVMLGYFNKPEATREAIDAEGWFHTGDIGVLDGDGFLKITDRKKDIIVTAGGKNIAPQPIENLVKASRFVSNAVMLGDRRNYPVMLVVPNMDLLKAWAAHRGLVAPDDANLVRLPDVAAMMDREVRKQLRDLAHFEAPRKLMLIPTDFSIERGELTPTMKVRRRVVEQNYAEAIETLYRE